MSAETRPAPPAGDISRLAEHLFREESGKLVSVLTRIFGVSNLQMAEDVVQEALVRALQTWPYYGVPDNPAAWLTQTAKNLALDRVRRETRFRAKEAGIAEAIEQWSSDSLAGESPRLAAEIRDARLRLLFACCHPLIPQEAQIALALRTLCGFSPSEIARAFLTTEAAIAKRLTRARQRIREMAIPFEIPAGEEVAARLDGVLQTLYLLFNEGYNASSGDRVIREELCREAIRLGTLVSEHPLGNQPRTHALLALLLLNAARLPARIGPDGNILLLQEQDRSCWNHALIARGFSHLGRSASGEEVTSYHLQAYISACHATAADYSSTDWPRILSLYDQLVQIDSSPVVALNRAVALAHVSGPAAAIGALDAIGNRQPLESYYLFYAVRADFEARLGNSRSAAVHLEKALQLTQLKSEQALLRRRLEECAEQG